MIVIYLIIEFVLAIAIASVDYVLRIAELPFRVVERVMGLSCEFISSVRSELRSKFAKLFHRVE